MSDVGHAEATPTPSPAVIESTPAPAVETPTPSTESATPAPSLDNDLKAIWAKNNPERDDSGRFLKRDEAQPQVNGKTTEPAAETAESKVEQLIAAIDMPNSLAADRKALWDSLPRPAQELWSQREKEAHEAISRAGQERKAFEPIQQTLEQFRDVYERNNLAPHDAMARMFAVEQWLATDPANAIQNIANAYGVDLSKIGTAEQPQSDPRINALSGEVSQLKSILTNQQRNAQQAERAETAREIAKFAEGKPHFESVKKVMAGLLQTEAATTLQEAYDMATRANPETWKKLQEETNKKEQDRVAKEAADKAAKAKRDAGVNVKSNLAGQEQGRTMDDDLRAIANKHYGRTRGV